ncbi:MAG: antibiotic biosynthesis monooxygenase family protein [bacterium]
MIMVESRFRVTGDMHAEVHHAFLHRPHLVDGVTGFLGMDVYTAAEDSAVFHLVTRWTDRNSYERWHRSDAHRDSHAFIPRGLKLEATFTRVTILDRIEVPSMALSLADSAAALGLWLADAATTYVVLIAEDGRFGTLNVALGDRLGVSPSPGPVSLAPLLANDEADTIADRIAHLRDEGRRGTDEWFLLNFVTLARSPFTLRCRLDVQPGYALLVGEDADAAEDRLRDELLRANNQLATLARERERQRQELEEAQVELSMVHSQVASALDQLAASHWHIRRIQELLPTCLDCGDVKAEDGSWNGLHAFLMANATSPILSHGYCPTCAARHIAQLDVDELDG